MQRFYDSHAGETALLVGNGRNLHFTPPAWFDYPSFGLNTIFKYDGWMPTYYTAVDSRVMREFGKDIAEKYKDLPKFVPTPNLDGWKGENFYRFYHRPGPLFPHNGKVLRHDGLLTEDGISYSNIMTVAMQLAWYMGFKTLLMIGVEHKNLYGNEHFWGCDNGMPAQPPVNDWFEAYKILVEGLARDGVRVLNISQDTYVSDDILPRGDWRDWRNKQ